MVASPKHSGNRPSAKGIKGAGMAGFFGVEQPLGFLQRGVGGDADRFVQQQHAIDRLAGGFHSLIGLGVTFAPSSSVGGGAFLASSATAVSIRWVSCDAVFDRTVVDEGELGHHAQLHAVRQLGTQEAAGTLQTLQAGCMLGLTAERGE